MSSLVPKVKLFDVLPDYFFYHCANKYSFLILCENWAEILPKTGTNLKQIILWIEDYLHANCFKKIIIPISIFVVPVTLRLV